MSERELICPTAFDSEFIFESYGVRIKLQASDLELFKLAEETARRALLDRVTILDSPDVDHTFSIATDDGTLFLFQNGNQLSFDTLRPRFFKFFDSMLRIAIAEYAVGWVFVHAGVVGWKGKAIVLPANSFQGKTTLVRELVKNGAEYYSDEYAVIDKSGLVHPFARDLTVRYTIGEEVREKRVSAESLGGKIGSRPIPVGLVLVTEFEESALWDPQVLTPGQGIMEVIPHTIPWNFNPEFSLNVLNTAISDAIILKCPRSDAANFALKLLSFFDNYSNLAKIT
jgi:hypothetical protein